MHHIQFCLEEILAEIDAELERNGSVLALAQLQQREMERDPVTAIDAAHLRDQINGRINGLPLTQARNRILQAQELVAVALGLEYPKPVRSNLVLFVTDSNSVSRAAAKAPAAPTEAAASRPAPQFKTMQERLAEAVGTGHQQMALPKRA